MIGLYGDLTKKGLYSVKSVYRVCVDIIINIDDGRLKVIGTSLRCSSSMWRLGRDCLPNRQRLPSKGVDYTSNRVVCHSYIEYN